MIDLKIPTPQELRKKLSVTDEKQLNYAIGLIVKKLEESWNGGTLKIPANELKFDRTATKIKLKKVFENKGWSIDLKGNNFYISAIIPKNSTSVN